MYFHLQEKVKKPNFVAKLLLKYREWLLNKNWYSLVIWNLPYRLLSPFCNHSYQVSTASKGFNECLCCFKSLKN